jgi:hypothetical protein
MTRREGRGSGWLANRSLLGYGRPSFSVAALALAVFLAFDGFSPGPEPIFVAALALAAVVVLGWWLVERGARAD